MIDQLLNQRYKILEVLGTGGFGQTYIARDLNRPGQPKCVVKQLKPLGIEDPTLSDSSRQERWEIAQDFFRREAEVLETLGKKHDRIPQLLAYFEEDQEFYLVQEFVDGHPLSSELVAGQSWPENNVIQMLGQVLEVLDFVHSNNVIHRDIKPDNIIRRQQDNALVLVDFGAVKQLRGQMVSNSGGVSFTVVIGTKGYRAMEQAAGRPRLNSDLYALGMIAVQALTGINALQLETEYSDADSDEINWQHLAPGASPRLKEFLTRMVRQNWRDRYQSAKEALIALNSLESDSHDRPTIVPRVKASLAPTTPAAIPAAIPAATPAAIPAATPATLAQSPKSSSPAPAPSPVSSSANPGPSRLPLKPLTLAAVAVVALVALAGWPWLVSIFASDSPSPINANPTVGEDESGDKSTTIDGSTESSTAPISSGEEILLAAEGQGSEQFSKLKDEGVRAMAAQDYWQAASKFKDALALSRNAPETRIYLNNALIGENKSYSLAVSVPANKPDRAQEMLRGFAQAQDEVNQQGGINGVPLRLVIANDQDDPDNIEPLARELADSEILGVMGHNRTEVSRNAGQIYQEKNLVLVTPISVMDSLTDGTNPYLFRTNRIDTRKGSQALADRMVETWGLQKVAIFSNPKLAYIRDMTAKFEKELLDKEGVVVEQFNLSEKDFDAKESLQQAKEKGAEVILLLPSISTLEKTWEVLGRINNHPNDFGDLRVLGDIATLYRHETLQEGGEAAVDMVLAVAWSYDPSDPFSQRADELWGASVNWVTAMSYDAAQALIEAIQRSGDNPTRDKIQKVLADRDFSATGTSGEIKFTSDGDVPPGFALVKVKRMPSKEDSRSQTGYDFEPVD